MCVIGGCDRAPANDIVFEFDSTDDTWSECAPVPVALEQAAACAVGSDIYVFGGSDDDGGSNSSVFKYDTQTDQWSTLAPMPLECSTHSASVLDGLVYITGLEIGTRVHGRGALRYEPVTGRWTRLASTKSSRTDGTSFTANGSLFVAGGNSDPSGVERYDVATKTWMVITNMLEGRTDFGAVAMPPAKEQDLFDSLVAEACRRHKAQEENEMVTVLMIDFTDR
jgi:hypothetical protein